MSDELEGWHEFTSEFCRKKIGRWVWDCRKKKKEDGWKLSISGCIFCSARPTLRECQRLAHATARLWAGEAP